MPWSMKRYENNVYEMLKSWGWDKEFERPGIYQIKIDGYPVYIGQSTNMLRRMAQHWVGIKTKSEHKYKILAEAKEQGHRVSFRVMYHAPALPSILLKEELGEKEGEYIREHRPALNIQIPKAENWRHYTINENAKTITLSEILSQAGLI